MSLLSSYSQVFTIFSFLYVVVAGVSPFFITFICNSLFVVYLPLFEIGRYLEDAYGSVLFWKNKRSHLLELAESEKDVLLGGGGVESVVPGGSGVVVARVEDGGSEIESGVEIVELKVDDGSNVHVSGGLDEKGCWTRTRVAKVSLVICPFWFLLTFNLSLKYTTVTSNTILSSSSSLFTFLVSLKQLGLVVWQRYANHIPHTPPLSHFWSGFDVEDVWFEFSGLLDIVLSAYLWVKAVLLTTTTVATAGLTIQVPLAAIVDSLEGNKQSFTDYVGAAAVMVGFGGINIPAEMFSRSKETSIELEPGTSLKDPTQIVSDSIGVDSSETVVF